MKRHAFKMKLKPDCEKEYKKHHDEIWPGNEAYRGQGNHQLSVADVDLYYDYSYQAPFLYFYTKCGLQSTATYQLLYRQQYERAAESKLEDYE